MTDYPLVVRGVVAEAELIHEEDLAVVQDHLLVFLPQMSMEATELTVRVSLLLWHRQVRFAALSATKAAGVVGGPSYFLGY